MLNATKQFIVPTLENIPSELRQQSRWLTWRAESAPGEKPRKVPHDPKALNSRASTTDPSTWATFEQAEIAYQERVGEPDEFTGIGFVLNGDGIAGVDIDNCMHDGTPAPEAVALLEQLGAAYVEVSPSGTGLRAFGYADNLERGCKGKHNGLDVELYTKGRFLTLTGQVIKAAPLGRFNGFAELAAKIRSDRKVNPDTGELVVSAPDERHAALVQRILSGDVYHDSLRDLAASLVATGMQAGAVVNHLRALMDSSSATHDERWKARRAQIPELVSSASLKFEPLEFSASVEMARAANDPRYKLLGADDLRKLPPLEWRVRGVLPAKGLAALYGPSASGKSFLAFDMAAAIAQGNKWFDCRVNAAPVVYAALEGEHGFKLRAEAWEIHRGRPLPEGLRMVLQPFALTTQRDVIDLAAVVPQGAVVVLDTLNRAAPTSDENSSSDMGEILEAAKTLQAACNGLVLLVHHSGKDASRGLRGHSSLFAAMDAVIEVSRDGERREWKVAKSKDGIDGEAQQFRLQIEVLGAEETGEAVTSCVVVRDTAAQNIRAAKVPQGANQRIAWDAIRLMFEFGETGKEGAPPFARCIELDAAITTVSAKLTCPSDRRTTSARTAIAGLVGRNLLGVHDGWLWLTQ